jgi:hypothetical protein
MKVLYTLLFLALSTSVYSQTTDPLYDSESKNDKSISSDTNYKYLKNINNQIVFEKIYLLDSLKSSQIEEMLISNIPNLSDIYDFQKSNNIITFSIKGVYIDIKKFGLRRMSMNGILAFPMNANISIVWKDGKYKLTTSNISFNVVSFGIQKLTQHILNKDGTLSEKKLDIQLGHCVEETLSEKFTITAKNSNW